MFQFYSKSPPLSQITALMAKFADLKWRLRNNLSLHLQATLFKGSADDSNLPICRLIDAFADDFHNSTISMFCDRFLQPYCDAYAKSPLKDVKLRYSWLSTQIAFYNRAYQTAFPEEWRMQYHLSLEFCVKTAVHLGQQLDDKQPDLRVFFPAFELSLEFEQKLADIFASTETVASDQMPTFENTVDGVRQKVEWRKRREQGIPEERKVPASEFIGSITRVFAPHMSLYVNNVTEELMRLVSESKKNSSQDIDESQHQLISVTTLVSRMRQLTDQCARFNFPQCLLSLFMNFKEVLSAYVQVLTRCLPVRPKTDPEFRLLAALANTSETLLSVVDSLASVVKSNISADLIPAIVVDDTKETIGAELRRQLRYIADVLAGECDSQLKQIGAGSWDEGVEGAKLPPQLSELLRARFAVLGPWLTHDNMNRLRSPFVSQIVGVIQDALLRPKVFGMDLGWKISNGVKELKALLMRETLGESAAARKRMDAEFLPLEVAIRVIFSPDPEAMAVTYISMWTKQNRDHYQSVLRIRGVKDQERYLGEYDKQLKVLVVE
jgi:hypothetical protein